LCKAVVLDLHPDFSSLSGTDFIFACAAIIEDATLVSQNKSVFQTLNDLNGLRVLFPEKHELPPGYRI
jgi:predicted nucleic acid-binding protein